jgi:UDP-2,3-diacylglucosamine pyrophosphatase LpxH
MKRVIISDLHIGSKHSNEEALIDFLSSLECDELILAGDIIDFIKIPSFTERSAALFKILDNFERKIIYIVGNHDFSFRGFIGKSIFGVDFVREYRFRDGKRVYKVEHGDKYDTGILKYPLIVSLFSVLQDYIERWLNVDITTWWHNLLIKKRKLRRIWDIISRDEHIDVLIMGHIHTPEVLIWVNEYGEIKTYANAGDWVEHQTYIVIDEDVIRLKNWKIEKKKIPLKGDKKLDINTPSKEGRAEWSHMVGRKLV